MKKYKIWNNPEKAYMGNFSGDLEFISEFAADSYRDEYLAKGYYVDRPHSVLEIHEFINNEYSATILFTS